MTNGKEWAGRIRTEVQKAIIGQDEVIERLLVALLANGHVLLEGLPGLAKTLLIKSLGSAMGLDFERIQFTPDLLPSDVVGTMVFQPKEGTFRVHQGPVFANLVLADEINRAPAKVQSALLEAMQERQVTIGGETHQLPKPFLVMATQNPLEQEGTYPLPEAQLDRFMFMINVDYPSTAEELQIMKMATGAPIEKPTAVLTEEEILDLQATVRRMPVAEHVYHYAERIVRVTRIKTPEALDYCKKFLSWGAGPRASLNLILAAKARAMLNGRVHVSCDDIAAVAAPILRHRIIPNFAAQSEGITADDVVKKILEAIPKDQKVG
jgi:MoxR-like ATPase